MPAIYLQVKLENDKTFNVALDVINSSIKCFNCIHFTETICYSTRFVVDIPNKIKGFEAEEKYEIPEGANKPDYEKVFKIIPNTYLYITSNSKITAIECQFVEKPIISAINEANKRRKYPVRNYEFTFHKHKEVDVWKLLIKFN